MRAIRGVLLDIDGTLVDSNDAHARAGSVALSEVGVHRRHGEVRKLIGMGGDKLVPALTGWSPDAPETVALGERRSALFRSRYLPTLRPFPEARALVERMKSSGITVVAASSATRDELDSLLAIADVRDLLDGATSSDDVDRSKPDPDVLRAALALTRRDADEVVMIGDTPYDVEAAKRAEVRAIALRCGGWDDDSLRGAAEIYDGPADLCARFATSLLGRA